MELTVFVYRLVKQLPASERFELSSQVRRSAVSVPSNVAEGQCSGRDGRYLNHLRIAQGSLGELETELEIARRLGFITEADYGEAQALFERTGQLLHGLARSVRRRRLERVSGRLALALFALIPPLVFALR